MCAIVHPGVTQQKQEELDMDNQPTGEDLNSRIRKAQEEHVQRWAAMTEEEQMLYLLSAKVSWSYGTPGTSRETIFRICATRTHGDKFVERICADPKWRTYLRLDEPAPGPDDRQTVAGPAPVDPYLQTR